MSLIHFLELQDLSLVKAYLKRYPPKISEITFTNLFVWRHSRPILMGEQEETIFFLTEAQASNRQGKVIFGPPLGKTNLLAVLNSLGQEIEGFVRIPENIASMLSEEGYHIIADRDNADYVYQVADLASLEGRRFHKKRNLIKQCLEKNKCQYEEITLQNLPECREMQDRWCKIRECGVNPGLCNEYKAIQEAFTHYELFNLFGGAIRIEGIIQAYSIGEELGPGIAVCHFEKAMLEIQGLTQLINQWFARYSLNGFELVNREQDLGIPGLRQAKESYYPFYMVHKFNAFRESAEPVQLVTLEPQECYKHTLNW